MDGQPKWWGGLSLSRRNGRRVTENAPYLIYMISAEAGMPAPPGRPQTRLGLVTPPGALGIARARPWFRPLFPLWLAFH